MHLFKRIEFKNIDIYLILLMSALIGIGILAISSATSYSGDTSVLKSQITFFIFGLILMTIIMNFNYKFLGVWYLGIYTITNLVLLAVLLFGNDAKGATRWISIGPVQIQPSEFAKITMILCTARLISLKNEKMNSVVTIAQIGLFQFVPFILINRQPNLSTSIVILTLLVLQLFVSKLKMRYILGTALVGGITVAIAVGYIVSNPNQQILDAYQRNRIVTAVMGGDSQSDNYQTSRSVDAIGSGGLNGKGLYQGAISQLNYLPESHNDFIVATIAEEFGFVGILVLLGIIILFVGRGLFLAYVIDDDFGRMILVGYFGMIAAQSFINLGVVTAVLPNTGLPLPFVSYGGSSLWANMMGMGLVLSVIGNREETMF
ncbi:MAG: cell division protein [Epulopiscium sp. Nele67-Bin004]|nr:MAG: cell division protein [Epulopiscium sp. Nele67-Bin004]